MQEKFSSPLCMHVKFCLVSSDSLMKFHWLLFQQCFIAHCALTVGFQLMDENAA